MKRILLLFAILWCYSAYSQITTVVSTLYSTADAYTVSFLPGDNFSNGTTMSVSKSRSGYTRSFLKFDLSSIPSDAVIVSAILKLTPSGTENVTATNSTQLYLDVCNTSWTETGISHSSNISNNTIFPTVTVSNLVSGKREFQIKNFVQAIADERLPNEGWRIRRADETTNVSTTYFTKEDATQSNRPQLVIEYYIRSYVSAATIVHTSSLNSTDGSISPTIMYGSNTTKTYRWFNASGTQIGTSQNLTGVGKGWYGLKYYGTAAGDTTYQAFIIGTECEEVSVTFDPGPNYIDDARFSDFVSGSGTTAINYPQANNGSNALMLHERWTNGGVWYNTRDVIKFRLWVDPVCEVNSAVVTLVGNAHNPLQTPNTSELCRITSDWSEFGVAHTNMPASTATGKITVPGIAAGNGNATPDIASFFNIWKEDNAANYGMLFQLQSYASNLYTRMQFHSSDAAIPGNRPEIAFSIKVNTCDLSRKGVTTVTYASANDYADLSTTITPPSWAVSPYHYMISEQPIPSYSTIYHTYQYGDPASPFSDTVLIDSTAFFNIGETALTKSFEGIAPGQYFLSVFDKSGTRIYDKQVSVNPMNYEINSNISFSNDEFTTTSAGGKAVMYSFINEKSEGASITFSVSNNSGETLLGLLSLSSGLSVKTDLTHGFIINGGTASIVASGVINTPFAVGPTDQFVIVKEGTNLKFYVNGVLKTSTALPGTFTYKTGVLGGGAGVKIKYKPIKLISLQLAWNNINEIRPGSCMGSFGKVSGTLNYFTFFGASLTNFSTVLTNVSTGLAQTLDAGSTAANYSFSNLLPGTYTLTTSFSWSTSPTIPVVYTTTIFVSSRIAWENIVNTTDIPSESMITTSAASGHATSVSEILATGNTYVDFGISLGGYVLNTFGPFIFMTPIGYGFASLGFYNPLTTTISNTVPANFTGYRFYKTYFSPYSFVKYENGIPQSGPTTFLGNDRFRFVYNSSSRQGSLYKLLPNGTLGAQLYGSTIQYPITPAPAVNKLMAYLAPNTAGRGFIDLSTNMLCPSDFVYAKLERQLLGVKYKVYLNKFYFFYDEEYASTSNLTYNVYDKNNLVVLNTTLQILDNPVGNTDPLTNTIIKREYGDNRYSIDVTSLSAGSYLLEVINEKEEKLYLRFIK